MSTPTLVFIGGGNMAHALINGLLSDGTPPDSIIVAEPDAERRERLAANLGIRTRDDNQGAAREADVLILAVKPQVLETVARDLSSIVRQRRILCLSIAAGITHTTLQQWLGEDVPLVRTMPNTPAMIQAGATGLYASSRVSDEQKDQAERIMRSVGLTQWVDDESLMDAVTAISGSGPAYFFLIMEAMEETAKKMGLPAETAHLLVLQTSLGAARMALENQSDLADLRHKVTSPGGTTEQAIQSFEQNGLRQIIEQALTAARDRSVELSQDMGSR
jgi:pyrroline-5-carboxylate reductase